MENEDTRITFVIGLAVGAVVGTVTALLCAPQSGTEVRGDIAHQGIELRARAGDLGENVRMQSRDVVDAQRNRWQLAMDAAREAAAAKREELLRKFEEARQESINKPLDEPPYDRT